MQVAERSYVDLIRNLPVTATTFEAAMGIEVEAKANVRHSKDVAFQLKAPPHPYAVVQTIDEATDYLAPYLREVSPV